MSCQKKAFIFFLLVLCLPSLFGQEVRVKKSGISYDFRTLQDEAADHDFDVLHYYFDWTMDHGNRYIQGLAVIRSRSLTDALDSISLHLDRAMTVSDVRQERISVPFLHTGDQLSISLAQTYRTGEEFEVAINYQGHPRDGLDFSSHRGQPIIWSLDEPIGARSWFPCWDLPDDKATAEIRITVPRNMLAASNGTLIGSEMNGDDTVTYVWQELYPISTYLIFVAATNYVTFSDTYHAETKSMEVTHFVYPEHLNQAREDFSVTVPQIAFFSRVFGEYPFLEEKYRMAAIPGRTSMEHQTCTSYSEQAVTGTHQYDWLIAHELAHQWWGDLVTLADWSDIWLNEGFATYSDALWQEYLYGFEGLKARVASFKEWYFQSHGGTGNPPEHPIHDPPEGHLFCDIEYEKAACVLHMLRFVVGDEAFWSILKKYAKDFAYANAATEDFRKVCESVSGNDLRWFFDQWIYEAGYPVYQFGWGYTGHSRVRVVINQIQEDFPLFRMPVELRFALPSGAAKRIAHVDREKNIFEFTFPERPADVQLDPDGWILCEQEPFVKKSRRRR